jgi:hypothetical protein
MIELGIVALFGLITYRVLKNYFKLGLTLFFAGVFVYWWLPAGIAVSSVFGINVYLADLILICSILLFFRSFTSLRSDYPTVVRLTTLIAVILCLSLIRGIFTFGLELAVNEARLLLYPIGAIMWSIYASAKLNPKFKDLTLTALCFAVALLVVELINIQLHGFGSASDVRLTDGSLLNLRPLIHIQALTLLASASVLAMSALSNAKNRTLNSAVAAAALLGVVVSQQRSVLIAGLVSCSVLFFQRRTAIFSIVVASLGAVLLFFVPWAALTFVPKALRDSIADSSSNLYTFFAREGSWVQYLESFSKWDFFDQLFGKPFGSGWGRYDGVNGLWVEFNPHNWYVSLLLRTGIVGLFLFMLLYFRKIVEAIKLGSQGLGLTLIQFQHLAFQFFYPMPWQIVQVVGVQDSDRDKHPPSKPLTSEIQNPLERSRL